MQDYHQLEIWHRAMDYAVKIYEFSAQLPADERAFMRRLAPDHKPENW